MANFNPSQYIDAQGNPTDPSLVALAQSIRQEESGNNFTQVGDAGTSAGGYQWNNGKTPIAQGQLPANFVAGAKQFGLDPTDFSPENQNKVAYLQMAQDKSEGLQPYQIASKWNSGSPDNWQEGSNTGTTTINGKQVAYNTPKYVQNVMATFTKLRSAQTPYGYVSPPSTTSAAPAPDASSGATGGDSAPSADASGYAPAFASSPTDSPATAGLKTAGNLLPSAINFGKGVLESMNPVQIIQQISQIPGAWDEALAAHNGDIGSTLTDTLSSILPAAYQTLVPQFGKDLASGNISGAQADVTNNPVGSIAPFVFAAEGGANLADRAIGTPAIDAAPAIGAEAATEAAARTTPVSDALNKGMSTIASPVTSLADKVAASVAKAVPSMGRYAFGQATGLEPKTISTIADNPDAFSPANAGSITRENLGSVVGGALQTRIDNLSESGSGYSDIRKSEEPVTVDPSFLKNAIESTAGVKINDANPPAPAAPGAEPVIQMDAESENPPAQGKITAPAGSTISNSGDISRLQDFYNRWQSVFNDGKMTPDQFLTMRGELSKVAYNDAGIKSGDLANVAAQIRGSLNTEYRPSINGLEDRDADFSSQTEDLKTLRKGLVDKEGNLTDGAVNKIANATGKGKGQVLSRLEEISPGITNKIQILKASEDLERAAGSKTGTYTRSVLGAGGLISGITTMNLPIIAASLGEMVLSNPDVATKIIRTYGQSKPLMNAIAGYIKGGASTLNQLPAQVPRATVFRGMSKVKAPATVFGTNP